MQDAGSTMSLQNSSRTLRIVFDGLFEFLSCSCALLVCVQSSLGSCGVLKLTMYLLTLAQRISRSNSCCAYTISPHFPSYVLRSMALRPAVLRGGVLGEMCQKYKCEPVSASDFVKSVKYDWFTNPTVFLVHAVMTPFAASADLPDSLSTRGLLIMLALGFVKCHRSCPECHGPCKLVCEGGEIEGRYRWRCCKGTGCWHEAVNSFGFLKKIRLMNWLAFLHFVTMLRHGSRWNKIVDDMQRVFGLGAGTNFLREWRALYQSVLEHYCKEKEGVMVGGKDLVVVFDETNLGAQKGFKGKTGSQARTSSNSRAAVRKRILKRKPARTIWRRSYTTMKRAGAMKTLKKKPAARAMKSVDKRSQGRWLWAAVVVGKKDEKFTHENAMKKFTFKVLPHPFFAPNGKPRGLVSTRNTIQTRIKKNSFVVFDKWSSSVAAIKQLGYRHAPPINHSITFRDAATGFHSNDIESEFNRLKRWIRERYGQLKFSMKPSEDGETDTYDLDEGDLSEYMFYVNCGSTMKEVCGAFHFYNGGRKNVYLR
jgi:hypothetical protein